MTKNNKLIQEYIDKALKLLKNIVVFEFKLHALQLHIEWNKEMDNNLKQQLSSLVIPNNIAQGNEHFVFQRSKFTTSFLEHYYQNEISVGRQLYKSLQQEQYHLFGLINAIHKTAIIRQAYNDFFPIEIVYNEFKSKCFEKAEYYEAFYQKSLIINPILSPIYTYGNKFSQMPLHFDPVFYKLKLHQFFNAVEMHQIKHFTKKIPHPITKKEQTINHYLFNDFVFLTLQSHTEQGKKLFSQENALPCKMIVEGIIKSYHDTMNRALAENSIKQLTLQNDNPVPFSRERSKITPFFYRTHIPLSVKALNTASVSDLNGIIAEYVNDIDISKGQYAIHFQAKNVFDLAENAPLISKYSILAEKQEDKWYQSPMMLGLITQPIQYTLNTFLLYLSQIVYLSQHDLMETHAEQLSETWGDMIFYRYLQSSFTGYWLDEIYRSFLHLGDIADMNLPILVKNLTNGSDKFTDLIRFLAWHSFFGGLKTVPTQPQEQLKYYFQQPLLPTLDYYPTEQFKAMMLHQSYARLNSEILLDLWTTKLNEISNTLESDQVSSSLNPLSLSLLKETYQAYFNPPSSLLDFVTDTLNTPTSLKVDNQNGVLQGLPIKSPTSLVFFNELLGLDQADYFWYELLLTKTYKLLSECINSVHGNLLRCLRYWENQNVSLQVNESNSSIDDVSASDLDDEYSDFRQRLAAQYTSLTKTKDKKVLEPVVVFSLRLKHEFMQKPINELLFDATQHYDPLELCIAIYPFHSSLNTNISLTAQNTLLTRENHQPLAFKAVELEYNYYRILNQWHTIKMPLKEAMSRYLDNTFKAIFRDDIKDTNLRIDYQKPKNYSLYFSEFL